MAKLHFNWQEIELKCRKPEKVIKYLFFFFFCSEIIPHLPLLSVRLPEQPCKGDKKKIDDVDDTSIVYLSLCLSHIPVLNIFFIVILFVLVENERVSALCNCSYLICVFSVLLVFFFFYQLGEQIRNTLSTMKVHCNFSQMFSIKEKEKQSST